MNIKTGKILSMTNYRHKYFQESNMKLTSRGILNNQLIKNEFKLNENCSINLKNNYNGFNIILCDIKPKINVQFISNSIHKTINPSINQFSHNTANIRSLKNGIHIISNGQINDIKIWARVRNLKHKLNIWLKVKQSKSLNIIDNILHKISNNNNNNHKLIFDELNQIISDNTKFNLNEIPNIKQCSYTLTPNKEQMNHQSIFQFDTISQTIIIVDNKNKAHFYQNDSRDNKSDWEYQLTTFS